MKYLFVYYGSGTALTPDQLAANRQAWQAWNQSLHETYGLKTARGGKVVTASGVGDYDGPLKGVSIVEAASLEEAVEKAKHSPSVGFGGRVEVFAEFD